MQWKSLFAEKFRLKRNWLKGYCTVRTFEGHTQGNILGVLVMPDSVVYRVWLLVWEPHAHANNTLFVHLGSIFKNGQSKV